MRFGFWVYVCMLFLLFSCSDTSKRIDLTLELAKNNRIELQKVLDHYKKLGDPQKLKAAQFLIANMYDKYSLYGEQIERYKRMFQLYDSLHSAGILAGDPPVVDQTWDSLVNVVGVLSTRNQKLSVDCQVLKADFIINNIEQAFAMWKRSPGYSPADFDLFCEYILPFRVRNEPIESFREKFIKDFSSIRDTVKTGPIGLVKAINNRLFWEWDYRMSQKLWDYPFDLPISKMEKGRRGACRHWVVYTALAMRSMGLPVAVDFANVWGNRRSGHSWNVLMLDSGKIYPFDALGTKPMEFSYKPTKIFRQTYGHYSDENLKLDKEQVPSQFVNANMKDVTEEYGHAFDVEVKTTYPAPVGHKKEYGVICVFDNKKWIPAFWGRVDGDMMHFKNMSAGVVYMPGYYYRGSVTPAGEPFLLQEDGKLRYFRPGASRKSTLRLFRKYPLFPRMKDIEWNIRRTNAEASNKADFKDSVFLFSIYEVPDGVADSMVNNPGKFRYIRFNTADYRTGNIAELEFYGKKTATSKEEKLTGKIIGFPVIDSKNQHPYTHAMDGNPETYFEKEKKKPGWVGLDLGNGNEHIITRIRFCPRSDTNFIIIGDTYELSYWDKGKWVSMGEQIAATGYIDFKHVPQGTLYLLHNLNRGNEERIFTYEKGKQVFW